MNAGNFYKPVIFAVVLVGSVFFQVFSLHADAEEMSQAVTMTLGDYRFDPDSIEVQSGRLVVLTLVNNDVITPHDFKLQDTAAGLDINISVSAGSTSVTEFIPEKPGAYTFYCTKKLPFMKSHRARGMEGALIVR